MLKNRRWLLALLALVTPGLIRAADGWAQLKIGMTADEAAAVLGEPLVRNIGNGFELWIYDQRAEVVFYGPVIGWTTPGTGETIGRVVDVWQLGQGKGPGPVYFLPRPAANRMVSLRREGDPTGENKLPYYRVRR